MMLRTISTALLFVASCFAQPFDTTYYPPKGWIPGVTVGIPGGVPERTNVTVIDVSAAPYNLVGNYTNDCYSGFASALAAAPSNSVIQFPNGHFYFSSPPNLSKSGVTVRAATYGQVEFIVTSGSPVVLLGNINIPNENQTPDPYTVFSGASMGSTNIALTAAPEVGVYDIVRIQQPNITNEVFPVVAVQSGTTYSHAVQQPVTIISVSGTNITFWPPLMWNFTNAQLKAISSATYAPASRPVVRSGYEGIIFSLTNSVTHAFGSPVDETESFLSVWCWFKSCKFLFANNYNTHLDNVVGFYMGGCTIGNAPGTVSVSNHGGQLFGLTGGCLTENSWLGPGLAPAVEINSGSAGNLWAHNVMTNNLVDLSIHNTHPLQNLFEDNYMQTHVNFDGYSGSASHQWFYRNAITDGFVPIYFKRWISYCTVVGNVLGDTNFSYNSFQDYGSGPKIIEQGNPNIGNQSFAGTNPPVAFNYPGTNFGSGGASGLHGFVTFPSGQSHVTTLTGGDFSFITSGMVDGVANGLYALAIQRAANTNMYLGADDTNVSLRAYSAGTTSNLVVNSPVTVSAGDTLLVAGPTAYQQQNRTPLATMVFNGNWDAFNRAQTFDVNFSSTLYDSLSYSNNIPTWWYRTNNLNPALFVERWPANDPSNAKRIALLPAQIWYADGSDPFTAGASVSCTYSIDTSSATANASGTLLTGSSTIGVTAGTGCAWTGAANVSWLHVTSGSSGTGNGSVTYTVDANSGSSRTGTLTVAGYTFTVSQSAVTTRPPAKINGHSKTHGRAVFK